MSLVRGLLLTVLLAALAGGLGAWLGARYVVAQSRPASLHNLMHDDLKLNADQRRRIEAMETDFAARRAAREAELRLANAELAAAIQARHAYTPEVQAAVDHFHHTMGELQTETIVHVLEMRRVLTPEQASRFDAHVGRALTEQPR